MSDNIVEIQEQNRDLKEQNKNLKLKNIDFAQKSHDYLQRNLQLLADKEQLLKQNDESFNQINELERLLEELTNKINKKEEENQALLIINKKLQEDIEFYKMTSFKIYKRVDIIIENLFNIFPFNFFVFILYLFFFITRNLIYHKLEYILLNLLIFLFYSYYINYILKSDVICTRV
jgi:regulator of replication initiation timing